MNVEFGRILACVAVWAPKKEDHRAIDFAAFGVD